LRAFRPSPRRVVFALADLDAFVAAAATKK
jgi:hypothetical protein